MLFVKIFCYLIYLFYLLNKILILFINNKFNYFIGKIIFFFKKQWSKKVLKVFTIISLALGVSVAFALHDNDPLKPGLPDLPAAHLEPAKKIQKPIKTLTAASKKPQPITPSYWNKYKIKNSTNGEVVKVYYLNHYDLKSGGKPLTATILMGQTKTIQAEINTQIDIKVSAVGKPNKVDDRIANKEWDSAVVHGHWSFGNSLEFWTHHKQSQHNYVKYFKNGKAADLGIPKKPYDVHKFSVENDTNLYFQIQMYEKIYINNGLTTYKYDSTIVSSNTVEDFPNALISGEWGDNIVRINYAIVRPGYIPNSYFYASSKDVTNDWNLCKISMINKSWVSFVYS